MQALGLMSGTSLDGVDIAVLETNGETIQKFGPCGFRPYSAQERLILKEALGEGKSLTAPQQRSPTLRAAEKIVTDAHIEAVRIFCKENGLSLSNIDIIGFHGQTVLHRPEAQLTVQIGDGNALAAALGRTVVHDFRSQDTLSGGQGAPLVPVFHRALAQWLELSLPTAFINIGGVSNITYIAPHDVLLACDTGPGNALIDDLVFARTGQPYDKDGALAAKGKVDRDVLAAALAHPFFAHPMPKSLDRDAFAQIMPQLESLSTEDACATLTAFTAHAIASCVQWLPEAPRQWVVAGGGSFNPSLLAALKDALPSPVLTGEELGLRSDALEAQAFAYLAVRSLRGFALTFPGTTGVKSACKGGRTAMVGR